MTKGSNNPPTSFLFVDHYFLLFFSTWYRSVCHLRYVFDSRAPLFMGFSTGCKSSTSPTPRISWEKHACWASYRAIMVNSWLSLLEWSKLSFTLQPPTICYLSSLEWSTVKKWKTVLLDMPRAGHTSLLRLLRVPYSPRVPSLKRLWSHIFWLRFWPCPSMCVQMGSAT